MPALDRWDTGYRSPDWNEREDWERRLDYHDMGVNIGVCEMRQEVWRICRRVEDDAHTDDHVRNILALLLREICINDYRMSSDGMRSYIRGLADQAYRENCVRLFHYQATTGLGVDPLSDEGRRLLRAAKPGPAA